MKFITSIDPAELPQPLQEGLRAARTPAQADMLLLSLLTASGYAMPHYYMRHGLPAKHYLPSLMTLVVAPPASGKGIMNLSKKLIQPIHEALSARATEDCHPCAFIPANSSSNAFLQLLNDNGGRGLMMETEIDVLSQIWRKDYGNYSAAFRQAFEHETISKARKMKGEELQEVEHPAVSVLLSGTPMQLAPMLQSKENGLASRFVGYVVRDIVPFDEAAIVHPDEKEDLSAEETYSRLAARTKAMYDWLSRAKKDCEWCLTAEQSEMLRGWFHDGYLLTLGDMQMPLSFDPVMKRLPITIQRIGMILTMLRYFDEEVAPRLEKGEEPKLPEKLVCSSEDFLTMVQMLDVLLCHALDLHGMLPSEEELHAELADEPACADDPAAKLLAALPRQFTTAEAVGKGKTLECSLRKTEKALKRWIEKKVICRISKGQYVKI